MIIHCPNCGYSRKPIDSAPKTECPNCKIVFEEFLSRKPDKRKIDKEITADPAAQVKAEKKFSRAESVAPAAPKAAKTTNCPACGGLVAYGAKTCPHCGQAKPAPKKSGSVAYVAAGLCVALIAGIVNSPGVGSRPRYDSFSAQTECEKFVSRSLKAPSSADFAPYRELAISGQGDGPWKVVGWVDAQNGFGAKIRSSYVCEIQFSGETVKLLGLSIIN